MKKLCGLLIAISLSIAGCGESSAPEKQVGNIPATTQPHTKKGRVALVMKTLTNPFFVEMERGARKAETELGVELIVKTAAQETSFEQQVTIVDDLIQNRLVDAIVLAPADAFHLVPSVKKARDSGIPVVNIDARLDKKALLELGIVDLPFISVDNEAGGYLSAKSLLEGVNRSAKVAILEGIRSAENAEARKAGAIRAFTENKYVKLVASETAHWKIDEAYDVTKAMLTKHPDISYIFAANDMMAMGAIKYLADAKRQNVKVSGFDALDDARKMISAGTLKATIDQQAAEQGYQGVLYAMRLLKSESLPAETLLNVKVVKSEKRP